jgi:hypothetical protein
MDIKGLEKAKSDPNVEYIKITASQRDSFTKAAQPQYCSLKGCFYVLNAVFFSS